MRHDDLRNVHFADLYVGVRQLEHFLDDRFEKDVNAPLPGLSLPVKLEFHPIHLLLAEAIE